MLKELKIAHHENSVPKKDFFSHFSTLIFEFKAKSDIEKWGKKIFFGTESSW
jgi:hypothetical protein